tara:strand:+ start:932 stop:2164 length:1233 start_codon:yes stop_codon:yes gene_type:complete
MPKILKDTIKKIERKPSLKIFKKDKSKNYYCSFYVGFSKYKSGNKEQSLKTGNVNDALKKAQQVYDETMKMLPTDRIILDFSKDIAQPFFKHRIRKYKDEKQKEGNENQGVREKLRYDNYIKMFFDKIDYKDHEALSNAITDLTNHLKKDNKTNNTISKYMSVLRMMFQKAQDMGVIKSIPDMPSLTIINKERESYFNEELNLITKRLQHHADNVSPKIVANGITTSLDYLGVKDFVNLCRSAGFRPGMQLLHIKNFQYSYITDKTNPTDPILKFVIFNTKTSPKHKLTCHPYFTKYIFPEIVSRYPNPQANDYLLFPNIKDRSKLYKKISKIFIRVSSELNLYHKNGTTRPLYSIRHTFISQRYNANAPLHVIARTSNNSEKVIRSHYLDQEDQMLINEHQSLFPQKKK